MIKVLYGLDVRDDGGCDYQVYHSALNTASNNILTQTGGHDEYTI